MYHLSRRSSVFFATVIFLSACSETDNLRTEEDIVGQSQVEIVTEAFQDTTNEFSIILPSYFQKTNSQSTEIENEGVLAAYQWTVGGKYADAKLYGEPLEINFNLSVADEEKFDMYLLEETPRTLLGNKDGKVYYYTYTRDVSCEQIASSPKTVDETTIASCELLKDFEEEVKAVVSSFKLLD